MWMTRNPVVIEPSTAIADAALLMARRRVRRLPVVAPGSERLVGIVSDRDVARAFPPDVNPFAARTDLHAVHGAVRDVMTAGPQTTTPSAALEDAAARMRDARIGALPVVTGDRLVGILTESDVFRALVEILAPPGAGVRIVFDVAPDEDVLEMVTALAARHRLRIGSVLSMAHEGRWLAVVRLSGAASDAFVDALWRSGHRVVSLTPFG